MELNILRADPAGNITVFVLDPVEKAQRAAIAEKIMAIPELDRKSTRLNSSHYQQSRMPSSA